MEGYDEKYIYERKLKLEKSKSAINLSQSSRKSSDE